MCSIRYIEKNNGKVTSDCFVKIGNKEFDLLDKPYYILRENNENGTIFLIHYLIVEENEKTYIHDPFTLRYGLITGRMLKLILSTTSGVLTDESWVKLEMWDSLWSHFEDNLKQNDKFEIIEKLKNAFEIIKRLYFGRYQAIEESTHTSE